MKMILKTTAVGLSLMLSAQVALADGWPNKPVNIWIGYGAGGTTDMTVRVLAKVLEKKLGVPVKIHNKAGAGASVLTGIAKGWKPDGYNYFTYLSGATAFAPHMRKVPYDSLKDFTLVSQISSWNFGIVVRSDAPYKTFEEFIAYAKKNPGKIKYATGGAGTPTHLTMVQIENQDKVKWKHVPFDGGTAANAALLGGHIDAIPDTASWIDHVEAGDFRMLAMFSDQRLKSHPDVPTLRDLGYDFGATSWLGLATSKGLDPAIQKKFDKIIAEAVKDSEYQAIVAKVLKRVEYRNSSDFRAMVTDQYQKIGKVMKAEGLTK